MPHEHYIYAVNYKSGPSSFENRPCISLYLMPKISMARNKIRALKYKFINWYQNKTWTFPDIRGHFHTTFGLTFMIEESELACRKHTNSF